ncbi:hypothetical protein CLAFUW4_10746 [Fulvia fulva]|nr:hypothetical protein CLAFUR4_10751 [Fulvia fulva]WPV19741.1 hypothetical protein CLAFUW4_10746 [Fulvia fulva]WPV33709.1 hypothetical protein CLAFUW7_10748 [Fulvia fulva]
MKPFHNETLRQLSNRLTAFVDVSGLKVEKTEAWGNIPPSIPEHITSRLQRIHFTEVQLLNFMPYVAHSIPAVSKLNEENDGKSAKHFNRISGIFERQPDGFMKLTEIRWESHTGCYIPKLSAPSQIDAFMIRELNWYRSTIKKQLPSYQPPPKHEEIKYSIHQRKVEHWSERHKQQIIKREKAQQKKHDRAQEMPGGTLQELLDTYGQVRRGGLNWMMPFVGLVKTAQLEKLVEVAEELEGKGEWVQDEYAT